METPQGNMLGILCVRNLKTHGLSFYVLGGRKLDTALLQSLATPSGMRVLIYSAAEQGPGTFLSSSNENFDSGKLMPLAQQALEQRKDASAAIHWENGGEEVFHAVTLPGYSDRPLEVLLIGYLLQLKRAQEAH